MGEVTLNKALIVSIVGLVGLAAPCAAQAPADFYKGKTVTLYVGYSVGGGYDVYGRILARFMGSHIPGSPTIVVSNMEGAASVRLANWLAQAAPKDGTAFGVISRDAAFQPLYGDKGAAFKGTDFAWIGSANDDVSVCVAWHTSPVKTFSDLQTHELIIGTTGAADESESFPRVMNGLLGTKFKLVSGYPGANDALLAMERGEVAGRCGWSWSSVVTTRPDWIKNKTVNVLVQTALEKHKDLPDTPLLIDLAATDEQRQIFKLVLGPETMGRPFLAPPGTDPVRVAILRKAFEETVVDPAFLHAAAEAHIEITPVTGEKVQALVRDIYATSEDIVKKTAAMLQ